MSLLFAKLLALFPLAWPEWLRRLAAWFALAIALIALLWSAKAIYDANVIAEHETERTVQSIDGRDRAAEARASDAIANSQAERDFHDAIDQATDSPPSDADRRLNCERLRQLGSVPAGC